MYKRPSHGNAARYTAVFCLAGLGATPALATNGYFANGFDTISKGMAGAGVAMDGGVMGIATNPALGTQVGNEAAFCLTYFSPDRSFDIGEDPTGFLVPGKETSKNKSFVIPCGGANFMLNDRSSLGLVVVGNGGMNTEYDGNPFAGIGQFYGTGAKTPYGVNLEQLFIGLNYAYEINPQVSVGIAPIYAVQRFSATGLQPFTLFSTDPDNVTDNDDSWSRGWGYNLGVHITPNEQWSVGAAYRSRIYMSELDRYSGLFAEHGDFDIPATAVIGAAFTPAIDPRWTITGEYQRIFYGDINAIANSGAEITPTLGEDDGPGFGWKDMDIVRLAASYEATDQWTFRGGVSYATEFIDDDEVLFNTLAPATPQWHASIGATYNINSNWSVSGSYTHAFDNDVSGRNKTPSLTNPVTLDMYQNELSLAMSYKW
jgi:long-chain fatty acid transport protein